MEIIVTGALAYAQKAGKITRGFEIIRVPAMKFYRCQKETKCVITIRAKKNLMIIGTVYWTPEDGERFAPFSHLFASISSETTTRLSIGSSRTGGRIAVAPISTGEFHIIGTMKRPHEYFKFYCWMLELEVELIVEVPAPPQYRKRWLTLREIRVTSRFIQLFGNSGFPGKNCLDHRVFFQVQEVDLDFNETGVEHGCAILHSKNLEDEEREIRDLEHFMPLYVKDCIQNRFSRHIQKGLYKQGTIRNYLKRKTLKNKNRSEATTTEIPRNTGSFLQWIGMRIPYLNMDELDGATTTRSSAAPEISFDETLSE